MKASIKSPFHRPQWLTAVMSATALAIMATVGTLCLSGCSKKPAQETAAETSDTLTDKRDGRKYRTVVIGGNRWMAENLNYRPRWGRSWCYNKDNSNCDNYGRLYDLKTAKTVCPSGWHLPSRLEWDDLTEAAGGSSVAGKALKTKSGWNDYQSGGWNDFAGSGSGNGTDEYGFSALPGGVRTADDQSCRTGGYFDRYGPVGYCHAGDIGKWWTASVEEFESDPETYTRSISNGWDKVYEGMDKDNRHAFSVRCTQNGNNAEEKEKQRIETLSTYFTDSRDGRTYRAVTIGANMWMAQNMDYTPKKGKSWCYENQDSNCVKYGKLYDWNTAMEACPSGWHLPSRLEWNNLGQEVGAEKEDHYWMGEEDVYLNGVGDKLKAKSGWKRFGYGTDDYGFSALPGGRLTEGGFELVGEWGAWWTASKDGSGYPYHRRLFYDEDFMNETGRFAGSASSVRCVADDK